MPGNTYQTNDFDEDATLADDLDSDDYEPLTEQEINYGKAVYTFLQELINADSCINDDYYLRGAIKKRYKTHCLCGKDRVSDCNIVYYDFKNIDKYRIYENKVAKKVLSKENIIQSLCDKEYIEKCFKELLCGKKSIYFPNCYGFRNNRGTVSIGLHSSNFNVTKNHDGKTVNLIVFAGEKRKIVTMRAVDVQTFERKLNIWLNLFLDFSKK